MRLTHLPVQLQKVKCCSLLGCLQARTDGGVSEVHMNSQWSGSLNHFHVCPSMSRFAGPQCFNVDPRSCHPSTFSWCTNLMQNLPKLTTFKGSSSTSWKSRGRVLGPSLFQYVLRPIIQMTKIKASWSHGSFDFKHEAS